MDLRKKPREDTEDVAGPSGPKELYQVIPERQTNVRGFMGSSTAYDLSAVGQAGGPSVLGADDRGGKVGYDLSIAAPSRTSHLRLLSSEPVPACPISYAY